MRYTYAGEVWQRGTIKCVDVSRGSQEGNLVAAPLEGKMTLIEAMEKAEDGNVIQRKWKIPEGLENAGMEFTMWARLEVTRFGRFLNTKWPLKLEYLKADNWEIIK